MYIKRQGGGGGVSELVGINYDMVTLQVIQKMTKDLKLVNLLV
jgi:hypothetical protein